MTTFILQGAKGGAGRTLSSVFLAAGLGALGHRPLHLQIAMSDRPPIIALAEGVPFKTTWLPEEHADADAIRRVIDFHSDCTTVVIDRQSAGFLLSTRHGHRRGEFGFVQRDREST